MIIEILYNNTRATKKNIVARQEDDKIFVYDGDNPGGIIQGFIHSHGFSFFGSLGYSPMLDKKLITHEDMCCICLDYINPNPDTLFVVMECKHVFHEQCIRKWGAHSQSCPLKCKKII